MLITFLALAFSNLEQPSRWVSIGEGRAAFGVEMQSFYDPTSIRSAGPGLVSVRTRIELSEPRDGYTRTEANLLFNCARRTVAILEGRLFNRSGTLIGQRQWTVADAQLRPIEEVSFEHMVHERVCRRARERGRR